MPDRKDKSRMLLERLEATFNRAVGRHTDIPKMLKVSEPSSNVNILTQADIESMPKISKNSYRVAVPPDETQFLSSTSPSTEFDSPVRLKESTYRAQIIIRLEGYGTEEQKRKHAMNLAHDLYVKGYQMAAVYCDKQEITGWEDKKNCL